jgi:diguanylate cyclase (GGDEF)-like protein
VACVVASRTSDVPLVELTLALATAASPGAAASVVVSHIAAAGVPFPSLYLEQAGRLRCQAQSGYWQVLDGIPCDVGIIGRCFRSGRTVEVSDAHEDEHFLFAAPEMQREISVPIRHAGQVVGVLNVESSEPFPSGSRALLEQAGAAYEVRLEQLGGPPAESPAQRVARLATAMSTLDREVDVRDAVLDAAIQLAAMPTAAIIEPDGTGRARIIAASGPLSAALREVDPSDLGQLDAWVVAGSSLYAHGTASSDLDMHGRLREAGVAALGVVPLTANGEHLGSLVVASEVSQTLGSLVMPSLEILGAQAAANICAVRVLAQLQHRVRQDPLTGLGHHATFQEELRDRLADGSSERTVAVLMVDVDDFKRINDDGGHQEGDRVLKELSATLASALRADDRLYRIGGDEFATIVEVDVVAEAQEVARRMIEAARTSPITVSIGIAVAETGEPAAALVARADAAMYAAKRAGRDTVGVA